MKGLLRRIVHFFAEISGWFLSIIMFLLVLNFVTRYFGFPIHGLLELSTFVFLAIIYLGMSHCEENDEHIKVNAVIKRLPEKFARGLNIFNYIVAVLMGAALTYAALRTAISAVETGEAVPGTAPLPTAPVKIAMAIGLLFFVFQAIVHFGRLVKNGKE